ncbi:MAG: M14 family zinc carboxypeptidase [Saprospiraceae bacterium]
MRQIILVIIFVCGVYKLSGQKYLTPFEKNPNQTATYQECISYYKLLDSKYKQLNVVVGGSSDVGDPIHLVILDENGSTDPMLIRKSNKLIVWINNGIHPGEPEGIDASMMLARAILSEPSLNEILHQLSIVIVPIYNVGGSLMRNNTTRLNQNGPESYGFRGNANNLDLNRDFIKQDSKNAITFVNQYQKWLPDIFIDNHTTDGADYQYNISLLSGMRNKLTRAIEDLMYNKMIPELYKLMLKDNEEMIPYVDFDEKIENGIYAFNDKARFSTGYAALFNAIPFVVETHMLKPYPLRVTATNKIMKNILQYSSKHSKEILVARKSSIQEVKVQKSFSFRWKLDLNKSEKINFKSYIQSRRFYPLLNDSLISYDRNSPIQLTIPYFQYFVPSLEITKPKYYIIPQAYKEVISNLKRNGVHIQTLKKDTFVTAKYYRILDYKSPNTPYENHFLHTQVVVKEETLTYPYHRGDAVISTDQDRIKFIMEVLEPQADDSYFSWNFFDGILMRKEYFSDYLFAPKAEEELRQNPELNKSLLDFIGKDSINNSKMDRKLEFIYKNSKFAEPYFSLYPVARIM